MLNSLIEKFKLVKDFRQNQGKRHELWVVLTIIMLSILAGHTSYKQIEQFGKNEKHQLIKLLKIPNNSLPSYATIRRIMNGVNIGDLMFVYNSIMDFFYTKKKTKDCIAIDGKYLRNTLTNYQQEKPNMLVMVSWFSQKTKLVIKAESFESQKSSETAQVLSMIKNCGLVNKVFTHKDVTIK